MTLLSRPALKKRRIGAKREVKENEFRMRDKDRRGVRRIFEIDQQSRTKLPALRDRIFQTKSNMFSAGHSFNTLFSTLAGWSDKK
jgi:hypothetical protein